MSIKKQERLALCFLGEPLIIKEEKSEPLKVNSQRIAILLAYLAVHKEPVKRKLLIELLWPEKEGKTEPQTRNGRFRVLLSKLKEILPNVCIITKEQISLTPRILAQTDVCQFELLKENSSIEDYKRVALLYRNDFLAEVNLPVSISMWEWIERQRTHYRYKVQRVLRYLAIYHYKGKRRSDILQALNYAQRSLEIEPWDDELQVKVALIHEQKGDYNLAIGQLDRYKELLKKDKIEIPEGIEYLYEQFNKKKKQTTLTKTQVLNMFLVGSSKDAF